MNKIGLRPIRDRVACEQLSGNGEAKTISGIILPQTSDGEDMIRAKVVAVGKGAISEYGQRIPMEVEINEIIVFESGLEEEIIIKGKTYLVIMEAEIIAVVDE